MKKDPRYPIYIISKGRWDSRQTVKPLERMNVPFYVAVEPQEFEQYARVIDRSKLLKLPFSNLESGSIPVRNWVWQHSIDNGFDRHWLMDDNIKDFYRYNNNLLIKAESGAMFRAAEDFTDRYENIAFSGLQYYMFIVRKVKNRAFTKNTRVYSCTLINNHIPFRWRGKYNEDTDICLRALKAGWCTALFYAFVQDKSTTMTMKGGNTEHVYVDGDNRRKFAESLYNQHPDVVKITEKWGRVHHSVDYSSFQKFNKFKLKKGISIKDSVDNYGMTLKNIT